MLKSIMDYSHLFFSQSGPKNYRIVKNTLCIDNENFDNFCVTAYSYLYIQTLTLVCVTKHKQYIHMTSGGARDDRENLQCSRGFPKVNSLPPRAG